jgi:hypothetical protein
VLLAGITFSFNDFGLTQKYLGKDAYPRTSAMLRDIATGKLNFQDFPEEWNRRRKLADGELSERLEKALSPESSTIDMGVDPKTGVYDFGSLPASPEATVTQANAQQQEQQQPATVEESLFTQPARLAPKEELEVVIIQPAGDAATLSSMLQWEMRGIFMQFRGRRLVNCTSPTKFNF